MTYKRRDWHFWHAAPGTAIVATLAMVGGFLALTISPASAATTTTTTAPTTTTTAVPGSNCSASVSGTFLDRTGWSATTDAPSSSADAPDNALDGNFNTRFSTNEDQASGLAIRVDLGAARAFDELAMRAPNSPNDYARGYDVLVSTNNSSWTIVAACTGTANPEIVSFPTQTAQWVRVVLTAASTTNWWSIDEFDLYSSAPAPTTTTTTTTTSTTTTVPTTTTRPKPVPAVAALSTRSTVSGNKVELRLRCSGATCRGTITLYEGGTLLATKSYEMFAGTASSWGAYLNSKALLRLVNSRYHTLNATEEVTVNDGTTVQKHITLVGPAVTALTTRAAVSGNKVELKLHCSGATCQGTIWLNYGRSSLAKKSYGMVVGTMSTWTTYLNKEAMHLLARARYHTLNATETVTVSDGPTVHRQITLVG
jgi:hypothetical protein